VDGGFEDVVLGGSDCDLSLCGVVEEGGTPPAGSKDVIDLGEEVIPNGGVESVCGTFYFESDLARGGTLKKGGTY
jgi:hypothetical protein